MTKPADRLRNVSNALEYGGSAIKAKHTADCAALLDECERVLRNANEALLYGGPQERVHAARQASATVAKLRGEL